MIELFSNLTGDQQFATIFVTLFVGLCVALLAAVTKLVITYWQGRQAHQTKILELAIQTAQSEFAESQKVASGMGRNTYPMSSYLTFHYLYLKKLEAGLEPALALQETLAATKRLFPVYKASRIRDYGGLWMIDLMDEDPIAPPPAQAGTPAPAPA